MNAVKLNWFQEVEITATISVQVCMPISLRLRKLEEKNTADEVARKLRFHSDGNLLLLKTQTY